MQSQLSASSDGHVCPSVCLSVCLCQLSVYVFACTHMCLSFLCYAPINVSPTPLPGEVRQSWGFDLIRIQLPHPPGKIQIQIPPSYTGHTRGVTGDLTRHAYEWHEPVLLHRYKWERIQRNRRVRRCECHDTVVIADGDKKNLFHTYLMK